MTDPKHNDQELLVRPPIIAVMGHIDHGKSTLLDYIRQTNVATHEAGGITQAVSAYEVEHRGPDGQIRKITFIDTPGHEAFSKMRERGANIADIVILIISAEEGVKAQTLETYKSIRESRTPLIIAFNKIDRPNANIDRCKQELAEAGILVEGYGGSIPGAAISAKSGEGILVLLDLMLLVAEMEELRGDPARSAEGYVLESNLDPKAGVTATLIIKNGTLKIGDMVVVQSQTAKLKKLEDFQGRTISSATFSSPVRMYGFAVVPPAGSSFRAFTNKKEAGAYAKNWTIEEGAAGENISLVVPTQPRVEIPVTLKADVHGSLEALVKELAKLGNDKIALKIVGRGVGPIGEIDVKLVGGKTNSFVIGFNVKSDRSAEELAQKLGVTIVTFDIIYKLSEWLKEKIKELSPKEKVEETSGRARIIKIFSQNKDKQVIGASALDGKIIKGKEIKIFRKEAEIGRGKILDLQEQKIKIDQAEAGMQFGAEIDSKVILAGGDVLEAFEVIYK